MGPNNSDYAIANISNYSVVEPNQCIQCHQGARDVALGFSFLQLSKINADFASFDIASINDNKWLTNPPKFYDQIQGSAQDQEAMGYLHGNCASCHNPRGIASQMNLSHSSGTTSRNGENAYTSIMSVQGRASRVSSRLQDGSMPSIGVAVPDSRGLSTIQSWINSL